MFELNNFELIKIGLASPGKIRSWSKGEVKKPETINYRCGISASRKKFQGKIEYFPQETHMSGLTRVVQHINLLKKIAKTRRFER